MSIKFTVLWIEDDVDYVKNWSYLIESHLKELGFQPEIVHIKNDQNTKKLKKIYDLYLVDFNLSSGNNGAEIINKIQKNEIYKTIILYSTHENFEDQTKGLEYVFFSDRNGLLEKVKDTLDLILNHSHEVNNMRGLVIAETIYLEIMLENFIINYFSEDDEKNKVISRMLKNDFRLFNLDNKYQVICLILSRRLKKLNVKLSSNPNNSELSEKIEKLKKMRKMVINFKKEIINMRNDLAHVEDCWENGQRIIKSLRGDEHIINNDFCISARKRIVEHEKNLQELVAFFSR